MSKRRKVKYDVDGKTALFLKRSSSGLVGGLPIAEDPRDPHLTITFESKVIGRHITYSQGDERKRVSLGKATQEEMEELRRFAESYLTRAVSRQRAWVPTRALLEELRKSPGEPDPQAGVFLPPWFRKELAAPDLSNATRWTETTVGKLSPNTDVFALSEIGGKTCLVFLPPDPRFILAVPFDELETKAPFLGELTGFGSLVRFLFSKPEESG